MSTLIVWLLPFAIVAIGFAIVVCQEWWERIVQRRADTAARADAQHAALMRDDDYGIYGYYPPADLNLKGWNPGWRAPEDLPRNLGRTDRGKSWTCNDGNKYLWTGTEYTRSFN